MKFSSLFVHKAASVAVSLSVLALVVSAMPLNAHATTTNGTITINSINGAPPTGQCIAGTLTFDVSGVTGSNGGPYSVEVGNGVSTSTPVSAGSGGGNSFSHITITYTPTGASNSIFVDLFHGSDTGNDSNTVLVNQCVAAPTQGVVNVIKTVVNNDGGSAQPGDFTMHIGGHSFAGSTAGTATVLDGSSIPYPVTEDLASGYTQTGLVCTGDDGSNTTNGSVVVVAGHNYTCTVTNDDNTPSPSADLSVTKSVDNSAPVEGANVVYTITVHNAGPSGATGVVANDVLPAGVTWVSDDSAGAYVPGTGVWTIGSLASGVDATLHITAQVNTLSQTTNTATVHNDVTDPNTNNNTSTGVNVTAVCPAHETNVEGQCVANTGTLEVKKVISGGPDVSPSQFSFQVTSSDGTGSAIPFDPSGTSDLHVAPGTFSVAEVANAAYTTTYDSCSDVTVSSDSTTVCTITNTFIPTDANLSVTKTVDNATPTTGSTITYTITAANAGPADATGVVVHDALPAGVTYVSDNGSGAYNTGTGDWTIGSLANGANAVLHITATVDSTDGGKTITNTASISGSQNDPNGNDNNQSVDFTGTCTEGTSPNSDGVCVPPPVDVCPNIEGNQATVPEGDKINVDGQCVPLETDLSVSKQADSSIANGGQTVTYTITATNNGPDDATGVTVNDSLPAGVSYVSNAPSQGTYDSGTGVWSVGNLTNGASATLTIVATANAGETNTDVTNTASISGGQGDSNQGNNSGSANTLVCALGTHVSGDACATDTGTLTIIKNTTGGDGTFSFSITGQDNVNVSTVEGSGQSDPLTLNAGNYDVTEIVPEGWNFSGVSCHYDNQSIGNGITNGENITIHNGDSVTCTFSDTKPEGHQNTPPVANDQSFTIDENTDLPVTLTATDADSDPLTYTVASNPSHGTLSGTAPNLTYTPNTDFVGDDSFTFTANDGQADSNTATVSITVKVPNTSGPTHHSSGGGGGHVFVIPTGQVLGAATSTGQVLGVTCGVYMDKHLRLGSSKNDPSQTKDLQNFLNKWMQANLPVTGFYGPLTTAATKAFQAKYADDILKPWNLTAPTGIVYFTTLYKINQLECPSLTQSLPALVPWSANPNAQ